MVRKTWKTYRSFWRLMKRQLRGGGADDARYSFLVAEQAAMDLARMTRRAADPVHRSLARAALA